MVPAACDMSTLSVTLSPMLQTPPSHCPRKRHSIQGFSTVCFPQQQRIPPLWEQHLGPNSDLLPPTFASFSAVHASDFLHGQVLPGNTFPQPPLSLGVPNQPSGMSYAYSCLLLLSKNLRKASVRTSPLRGRALPGSQATQRASVIAAGDRVASACSCEVDLKQVQAEKSSRFQWTLARREEPIR